MIWAIIYASNSIEVDVSSISRIQFLRVYSLPLMKDLLPSSHKTLILSSRRMWNQTRRITQSHWWPNKAFEMPGTFWLHTWKRAERWGRNSFRKKRRTKDSFGRFLSLPLSSGLWGQFCHHGVWSSEKWRKRSRDIGQNCYHTQPMNTHKHTHMHLKCIYPDGV